MKVWWTLEKLYEQEGLFTNFWSNMARKVPKTTKESQGGHQVAMAEPDEDFYSNL